MKKILLSSLLLLGVGGVSMAQERQAKVSAPKKAEKSTKAIQTQKSDPAELTAKPAIPVQVTYSDAIERAVPIQLKAGSKKEN